MAAALHAEFIPDNFRADRYWQGDFQHNSWEWTGVQWAFDNKEQFPDNREIGVRMRQDMRVQSALQELQYRKEPAFGQVQRSGVGFNTVQTHFRVDELIALDNRDVHRRRAAEVLHAGGYWEFTTEQDGLLLHKADWQLDA